MADPTPPAKPSKAIVFARRTLSTVGLWGLIAFIFASHKSLGMICLVDGLTMIAIVEYFRMMRAANAPCFPRFGIALAAFYTGYLSWFFYQGGKTVPPDIDAFAIFLAVAVPFAMQLRHPIKGLESLTGIAINLMGFVYVPFLFHFSTRLTFMPAGANPGDGILGTSGAFLLLWLLTVTKFTDMGAYIVGSMLGRHKMIPHVSPGKTWEGFVGALFFPQLAACGLYGWFPQHLAILGGWPHVIFLGFLLSVLAVIGDLAESVVKRALNAKDSGRMLPGIGGSLDLIDSICFTAPALYFYIKWVLLPHA